jgi:mycobactin lysine-N-oxygenase
MPTFGRRYVRDLNREGLVMTGPGTPLTIAGQPKEHPCIMDGASFWLRVEEFVHIRSQITKPLNIGVIGTGETAAAIVVALVDALRSSAFIEVISPYGVIYSRDERFEENKLFSDPDGRLASLYGDHQHAANWLQLSERDRREFVRRTDRGVFSLKAMGRSVMPKMCDLPSEPCGAFTLKRLLCASRANTTAR